MSSWDVFDPRLIQNLRRFSTQAEAAAYLDLVGGLLTALNVSGDDLRFHFNPAGGPYFLPLTIHNRYIVTKGRDVDTAPTWWLIQPGPHAVSDAEKGEMLHSFAFAHKRCDAPESAPRLVQYRADFVLEHLGWLRVRLHDLAARELSACRGMIPRRISHGPLAFALALDDEVRADVLPGVALGRPTRSRRSP